MTMLYTTLSLKKLNGDQMMHSNNYLDEENGDAKPSLEEIINDLNEHKNIENDCVLTKINS